MRAYRRVFAASIVLFSCGMLLAQQTAPTANPPSPDDQYVPGPDSKPQAGVPQGKIFEFSFAHSKIFPGTTRTIKVYIPSQYHADKPACVYVGLDGLLFLAPTVFDNLINKREMPVTIAIGVPPGTVDSATGAFSNPRLNRSLEFDGMNGNLARFLLEEVLPEVERHKTPDGLPIVLSKDPNDRAAGGASTGGIGSFSLVWQRPDAFRRVFTAIGTFVGMRGGDRFAVLVRKTEPKPLRVFMQDGSNDQLTSFIGEVGDWWMSNQTMYSALRFAGYQVEHVWGEGSHNGKHPTAIFPDAMRWLWKDWPQPVVAGVSQNTFLAATLSPAETWQIVPGEYQSTGVMAANREGEILFQDIVGGKNWKIAVDGRLGDGFPIRNSAAGLAVGPDGRIYVSDVRSATIVAYGMDGKSSKIATGIRGPDLVVTHGGNIYATDQSGGDAGSGRIWLVKPNGDKSVLDTGLNRPTGITLSPDGLWLAVAESKTHWGYSYHVEADGSVRDKQQFYWFHVPDSADDSGAGTWVMDREGRLYASTRMGVQIFDRNGRARAILPLPGGEVLGLSFGGTNLDVLYVVCADHKIYWRKLKVSGQPSWAAPIELPKGDAG